MKDRFFRFRRLAVTALTGATVMGGVAIVGGNPAGAATPTYADVAVAATAVSTPTVSLGHTNQAAGDWTAKVYNDFSPTSNQLVFQVYDPSGNSPCGADTGTADGDFVGFSATPQVTVTADSGNTGTLDTKPVVTASLSSSGTGQANCNNTGINDILTLTEAGTATGTPGDEWDISVTGVKYDIGSGVPSLGNIGVGLQGGSASYTGATTGPSNATIGNVTVTANVPPVGINRPAPGYSASNQAISPITITEDVPGVVTGGGDWVCVWLDYGSWDVTSGAPVASVSGGGAALDPASSGVNPYVSTSLLSFQVKTTSSGSPATYTLSNLHVDPGSNRGPDTIYVAEGATSSSCSSYTTLSDYVVSAFDTIETERDFGPTADDTAAKVFDNTVGHGDYSSCTYTSDAVLARDDAPYDALAASFLGGDLGTGILLTPGGSATSVSSATLQELRVSGITTVYVVGGPLAISDSIVNQLQNTLAYNCGGATPVGSGTTLSVVRIWGQNQDGTAQTIDDYVGSADSLDVHKGYGLYNNTSGTESAAPAAGSLTTAVLAVDTGWQDAVAAGVFGYTGYPIILSPTGSLSTEAMTALTDLGIQQVIVMGGPLAISDNVVTQLEGMGLSVLRVAGADYTDTAQLFATFYATGSGNKGYDEDDSDIIVSRGDFFADALSGSTLAWWYGEPIVLTVDPNTIGSALTGYLNAAGSLATDGINGIGDCEYVSVLGGSLAVTPGTVQNILNDISAGNNS